MGKTPRTIRYWFEEWVYGGRKVPKSHEMAHIAISNWRPWMSMSVMQWRKSFPGWPNCRLTYSILSALDNLGCLGWGVGGAEGERCLTPPPQFESSCLYLRGEFSERLQSNLLSKYEPPMQNSWRHYCWIILCYRNFCNGIIFKRLLDMRNNAL